MSTSESRADAERKRSAEVRARFLRLAAEAAIEYAAGQPLSVSRKDQQHAVDRTMLAVKTAAARNPKIYTATPESLARAIALCALTGLRPGGPNPEVDLIPRIRRQKNPQTNEWEDGPTELSWQIGWRGYVTLAGRAGCRARVVPWFDEDHFDWEEGSDPKLEHRPDPSAEGYGTWDSLRGCYVVARHVDGFVAWEVLERRAIEKRRDRSEGWRALQELELQDKAGRLRERWKLENAREIPWVQWPIEMARKTAIRYAGSRGLLPWDEVALFAVERDTQDDAPDVIDHADVRATPRALPDYDLGAASDDLTDPADAIDRLRSAAEKVAAEPPPKAEPKTKQSYPDGVGDPHGQGDTPPPAESKRAAVRNDILDTERVRDHLATVRGPGAVLTLDQARSSIRQVLSLRQIYEDRFRAILTYGSTKGFWAVSDDKVTLPGAAPPADPEPGSDAPDDDEPMTRDELLAELAFVTDRARELGIETAALKASSGLARFAAMEAAPDDVLSAYLIALTGAIEQRDGGAT